MDFARQQRDPTKHLIGIAFVVLVHVIVIYALLTGLGRAIVEVVKKPLNATIIEEIKAPPPPPPPPKKIIEPPKTQQIVQPYIPPPDIPVPTPQTEPVISNTTTVVPTEPNVIAPVAVAPPAPKPAVRQGISCNKQDKPVYPREAIKAGVQKGKVDALVSVDERGNVTDVKITSADPPRYFDRVVHDTLMEWKCVGDGSKYVASVELNFKLVDE